MSTALATLPYCLACGYDLNRDFQEDVTCDSCGMPNVYSGVGLLDAPTDLDATGGSLQVTFTWTEVVGVTYDFLHATDDEAPVLVSPATSPQVIVAADGEKVAGQVRAVVNGIAGPWSIAVADVATA